MPPPSALPTRPSPLRQAWNVSQASSSLPQAAEQQAYFSDSGPELCIDEAGEAFIKQRQQQPESHSQTTVGKLSEPSLAVQADAAWTLPSSPFPLTRGRMSGPRTDSGSPATQANQRQVDNLPRMQPAQVAEMHAHATMQRIQQLSRDPLTVQEQDQQSHPALTHPFPPTTQFFILDSQGNDPSGLATYTPVPPHPDNLIINPTTGERLYYLVAAPTVFRASESRLLPVGYKCGDAVKQRGNVVGSTVMRRFVVGRERRYDLKDELGCVWRDVREVELMVRTEGLQGGQCGWGRGVGRATAETTVDANGAIMELADSSSGRMGSAPPQAQTASAPSDVEMKME